jgi:hypothetical protein
MTACCACGLHFSSVAAFDAHRIGEHAYTLEQGLLFDTPRSDGRRCLSRDEMSANGWAVDGRGRLVHPREARRIRRQGRAEALVDHSSHRADRSPTPLSCAAQIDSARARDEACHAEARHLEARQAPSEGVHR